jgi:hypothetical protein
MGRTLLRAATAIAVLSGAAVYPASASGGNAVVADSSTDRRHVQGIAPLAAGQTDVRSPELFESSDAYVGVVPARVLETRRAPGLGTIDGVAAGIGVLAAGSVTELQVAGRAGVPVDASAVVLNVTVTGPVAPGFVTVFPCGAERPNAANLNYVGGQTVPNAVISRVGTEGKVCFFTMSATDLVVDVNGYHPTTLPGNPLPGGTIPIPESTVVVSGSSVVTPSTTHPDGSKSVTLANKPSNAVLGGFMAVQPTPNEPFGSLGKIVGVTENPDGTTSVTTAPARLDEAFPEGKLAYVGPLTPVFQNGAGFMQASGDPSRVPLTALPGFKCGLDADNAIDIGLDISLGASVDYVLEWGGGGVYARIVLDLSLSVEASATGGLQGSCKHETPRMIGWTVMVGPVPVAFSANHVAEVVGRMDFVSVKKSGTIGIRVGFEHKNGKTDFIVDPYRESAPLEVDKTLRPDAAELTVFFGPKISALVFGVVGLSITAGPEIKVGFSQVGGEYRCKVTAGMRVALDAEIGKWFFNINFQLAARTFGALTLGDRACGTVPPPAIRTQSLPSGLLNLPYFVALSADDGARPLTWSIPGAPPGLKVVGDSIQGSPTAVGEFSVALTATDSAGRASTQTIVLTVTTPSPELRNLFGKIARVGSDSWYVDRRGGSHRIPSGGVFECIEQQGKEVVDTTATIVGQLLLFEPAECVRANPGDIARISSGDAWLIDDGFTRRSIRDGGTYMCLVANGHREVNVPRYWLFDLLAGEGLSWSCWDAMAARGKTVRASDGSSWYVDLRGGRHHVPDGRVYSCLIAQGKADYGNKVPREWIEPLPHYEDAECVHVSPGNVIAHADGDSYLINSNGTRSWIVDGGTFMCLQVNGRRVVRNVPRYFIDDLTQAADFKWSCWNALGARGKVVRAGGGSSWYIDLRGGRHHIPDGGVYDCLVAQGRADYGNLVPLDWIRDLPRYEDAECVRAAPGNIITHADGDSYVINANWSRSWIADGPSFLCLQVNGHEIVRDVPRYYIDDLVKGTDLKWSCWNAVAARGRVVRSSNGSSWYVDLRGGRHHIPNGGVYECLVAQGKVDYGNIVPNQWITPLPEHEGAECVRANPGNLITHANGDSYVINGNWTRSWIANGGTFRCLEATGAAVVRNVPRYYIDDLSSGADLSRSCIIRGPGGDSHFVNSAGRREWIPDSPTWDCETGRGVPVLDVSNSFIAATPETGWHYCLNQALLRGKVLRHSDGDSHYIHPDNTRTWIPDAATYNCRVRQGKAVVHTRWREYVESFSDRGWDYCYDNAVLRNKIIVHPDGDRHFVDSNGVRHWIPPGPVYDCLVARGHSVETVRWREYINATPEREWAVCGSTLTSGQRLDRGQWLRSSDGRYTFHMQGDGNLVLYNPSGRAIWATNVAGDYLILHGDGNLIVHNWAGAHIWSANRANSRANRLVVQNDGNVVLYTPSGQAVWATNTVGR